MAGLLADGPERSALVVGGIPSRYLFAGEEPPDAIAEQVHRGH